MDLLRLQTLKLLIFLLLLFRISSVPTRCGDLQQSSAPPTLPRVEDPIFYRPINSIHSFGCFIVVYPSAPHLPSSQTDVDDSFSTLHIRSVDVVQKLCRFTQHTFHSFSHSLHTCLHNQSSFPLIQSTRWWRLVPSLSVRPSRMNHTSLISWFITNL